MFKRIQLEDVACFEIGAALNDLDVVNFLYGPNGSGKTSISTLISREYRSSNWVTDEAGPLRVEVFNRDTINSTFLVSENIPGVFILGEEAVELRQQISGVEASLTKNRNDIASTEANLSKCIDTLNSLQRNLQDDVWLKCSDIPSLLRSRLRHAKASGNKTRTLQEVLVRYGAQHESRIGEESFTLLEERARTAFDSSVEKVAPVPEPPSLPLSKDALVELLGDSASMADDVSARSLARDPQILTWIRQGLKFLRGDTSDESACPFCTQNIPEDRKSGFEALLRSSYEVRRSELSEYLQHWTNYRDEIQRYFVSNTAVLRKFSSADEVDEIRLRSVAFAEAVLAQLRTKMEGELQIEEVQLDFGAVSKLTAWIDGINVHITEQAAIVENRRSQADEIVELTWMIFANRTCKDLIRKYELQQKPELQKQAGLENTLETKRSLEKAFTTELDRLHRGIRSSGPAIKAINDMLVLCQFHSFHLDAADGGDDGFCLRRGSGEIADARTLSEGERTFISFLYFIHSLRAADNDLRRILAVIDDPISSLDSDTMFVVSTLVRRLVEDVTSPVKNPDRREYRNVAQLLMLTHSTKFHGEVTYERSRNNSPSVKYYRIRKFAPEPNVIEDCGRSNPIRTAYQELWDEVAAASENPDRTMPWLPNVLRRIIESYFSTFGDSSNLYNIGDSLPEKERILFRSLIAWSHAGSHLILDAEDYVSHDAPNRMWIQAFKCVFAGSHSVHYDAMMARSANRPRTS